MKTVKLLLLSLSLFTTISTFAHARDEDGDEKGNGGDEYAKEFVTLAYDLMESLQKNPIPMVDNQALLAAIRQTKVNSRPSLTLRGNEVDAINYPDPTEPKILLSRAAWDRMATARHRRVFLVLHEYLGIMGVDDSNYQISHKLDSAGVCDRHPHVRQFLEEQLKKFCYRITRDDLYFLGEVIGWYKTDRTEGADLAGRDFAGLDRTVGLTYNSPINRFSGDVFRHLPKLKQAYAKPPVRLARLEYHPALEILYFSRRVLTPVKGENVEIEEIADGAFAELENLRSLYLDINLNRVDITRALAGVTTLSFLGIKSQAREIPFRKLLAFIRQNPPLSFLDIEFEGDRMALLKKLTDHGIPCNISENFMKKITCDFYRP